MQSTFEAAHAFNSNLSTWDVSKVTSLYHTFYKAAAFTSDLSKWEVSKVTTFYSTFNAAGNFNSDLSKWEVSKATSLISTFNTAGNFNSDLSKWEVGKVVHTHGMFRRARAFNSDLSTWQVGEVKDMQSSTSTPPSFLLFIVSLLDSFRSHHCFLLLLFHFSWLNHYGIDAPVTVFCEAIKFNSGKKIILCHWTLFIQLCNLYLCKIF